MPKKVPPFSLISRDQQTAMTAPKRTLPTLEDVASFAEVSTATVSRCLNQPNKVSKKTRDRVMLAVGELHYTPNFGARAIAANRTGIYGAVIPTMDNAIFARGIESFQQTLVQNNRTMVVASSAYDTEQELKHIRTLVAHGADGMLLIGSSRDPQTYRFLLERNIPVITAWAISSNSDQSFVGFDNRKASRRLAEAAIEMGHTSFAYISAHTAMNDRAFERVEGAKDALAAAKMNPSSMPIVETNYSLSSGRSAFKKIFDHSDKPTIIMCGNDVIAVGAIQAAQQAGLNVPGDVSIVGFDNIEISTVINPALTTVHVPHCEMGRLAADALQTLVATPSAHVRIELDTKVVLRDSLAPPKK